MPSGTANQVTIVLRPLIREALKRAAEREALPISSYIRQILVKSLRESGDLPQAEMAQ